MKKRWFQNRISLLLFTAALILTVFSGRLHGQGWIIYDGSMMPNKGTPPFASTMSEFNAAYNKIVIDTLVPGNKWLWMDTGTAVALQYKWSMDFADKGATFDEITVVMRVRGHAHRDHVVDFDMQFNERRTRVSILTATRQPRPRRGRAPFVVLRASLTNWNILRFTMTATEARMYLNENPQPAMTIIPADNLGSPNRHFRFGDGDTGNTFGADIDWMIWDTTGAYSPGEGTPVPTKLISSGV